MLQVLCSQHCHLVVCRNSYKGAFIDTGSKPWVVMGSKVSTKMAAPTARVIQVMLSLNL